MQELGDAGAFVGVQIFHLSLYSYQNTWNTVFSLLCAFVGVQIFRFVCFFSREKYILMHRTCMCVRLIVWRTCAWFFWDALWDYTILVYYLFFDIWRNLFWRKVFSFFLATFFPNFLLYLILLFIIIIFNFSLFYFGLAERLYDYELYAVVMHSGMSADHGTPYVLMFFPTIIMIMIMIIILLLRLLSIINYYYSSSEYY